MRNDPEPPALPPIPWPQGRDNNFWYVHNGSDTVIVFLHGLFSNSYGCWRYQDKKADRSVFWPDLVRADPRFAGPSIYLAGYFTQLDAGDYPIAQCAGEVFDALRRPEADGLPSALDKRNLIFVCHSTGGIVARYLLVRHKEEFRDKGVGLALIASPSLGSRWADLAGLAARYYNQQLGSQLRWQGESLRDLHGQFRDLVDDRAKLMPGLFGMEASESKMIVRGWLPRWLRWLLPNRQKVVTALSAGQYFREVKVLRDTDHFSTVKPDGLHHPAHEFLVTFVIQFRKFLAERSQQERDEISKALEFMSELKKLLSAATEYEKGAEQAPEPPPPPEELTRGYQSSDAQFAAVVKKLAEYERRFGPLPDEAERARQAEQELRQIERVLTTQVTLRNSFIERYRNQVTADTRLLVDKVGKVQPPKAGGAIHIACRDDDLGFVVVARILNAKEEQRAVWVLREAEGTGRPVRVCGVWRLWPQHAGAGPHIQGDPAAPATTANPAHIFEIHPVTRVAALQTSGSLRPAAGYEPKAAVKAFVFYENLPCKLRRGPAETTLTCAKGAHNYVEFVLEARGAAREVEDGWFLNANVRNLDGEVVVEDRRTVFVKGTPPAEGVGRLRAGDRLHVLGMPRVNLAEIAAASEGATGPEGLPLKLPYEMVVIGVFGRE
jgi:pimeloyl-ACP methyl ester carboxylesterase